MSENEQIVVLMLDQSKISDKFECLMVLIGIGKRALSLIWKFIKTNSEIGFNVKILDLVKEMMPKEIKIMLTAYILRNVSNCRLVLKSRLELKNKNEIKSDNEAV